MDRCPTCSKPLGATVTDRVLAALATAAGQPVASRELARITGATPATIYTVTRRLSDKGAIRKALIEGISGWVIASQQGVPTPVPTPSGAAIQDAQKTLVDAIQDFRIFSVQDSVVLLANLLQVGEDGARLVFDALVRSGQIEVNGEAVSA